MKRVAFVFSTVPHGSASGREGLDALLATSALTEDLGVFFIGDGVFQILQGQQPDAVLARDYIATFKLLGLYDIDQCWLCAAFELTNIEVDRMFGDVQPIGDLIDGIFNIEDAFLI